MAYRKKKDTDKTLELVLWLLLGIPMAVIAVIRLIFSGSPKSKNRFAARLENIHLDEVDQMDGFSFESYIAELLKAYGFRQVVVTSGSGDFGVDITAFMGDTKYAFQCKNYQSSLGVAPIQEVYSGAPMYNASVCVVVTNAYFTPHAIELAGRLGVRLWDRVVLSRLIEQSQSRLSAASTVEVNSGSSQQENINSSNSEPVLSIPISGGFVPATLILTQQNLIYQTKQGSKLYPISAVIGVSRFYARLKIVIRDRNQVLDLAVGDVNNALMMEQEINKLLNLRHR